MFGENLFRNKTKEQSLYFDYAASTPLDDEAYSLMERYWKTDFAHPWSLHEQGESVGEVLREQRSIIAGLLGIQGNKRGETITFTSGGTESNSLALRGALDHLEDVRGNVSGLEIIVGAVEHPSVLDIAVYAKKKGMNVRIVPTDEEGVYDTSYIEEHLNEKTVLISIQAVNSEIGVIQPLKEIGRMIDLYRKKHAHNENNLSHTYPLFHSDASQAFLWTDINVDTLHIDLLTLDAHKVYGPKGVGVLYVRKGVDINPLFLGSEGKGIRSGTPAMPLIVGATYAFNKAEVRRVGDVKKIGVLRDFLISSLKERFPESIINGSLEKRVANNISVTFPNKNHEFLQVQLSERGISVATRSACLEEGGEGSYVMRALGNKESEALRITLGRGTAKKELESLLEALEEILSK